jgi:2-keto-4-pentenoate hydratase
MDATQIEHAANLLNTARHSGHLLDALPASCAPTTVAEAHAIQDACVKALAEPVAGWKISAAPDGSVMRGVLLRSRVLTSPARLPAKLVPMRGVEAEIAFHVDRALGPRERDYSASEVAAAVTAMVAIEVVDTRFRNYDATPSLHRLADFMSSGAFVQGTRQPRWRDLDLTKLHVSLSIDGQVIVDRIGGHPTLDPLLPALALINHLRTRGGVPAGMLLTTGSFTGMNHAAPGQSVEVTFDGVGSAQLTLED